MITGDWEGLQQCKQAEEGEDLELHGGVALLRQLGSGDTLLEVPGDPGRPANPLLSLA